MEEILRIPLIGVIPESENRAAGIQRRHTLAIHMNGQRCSQFTAILSTLPGRHIAHAFRRLPEAEFFCPVNQTAVRRLAASFLSYLMGRCPPSAAVAKERLQSSCARARRPQCWTICRHREELIAVISKYIFVNQDDIKVSLENRKLRSTGIEHRSARREK